jgi:hypothetical protein
VFDFVYNNKSHDRCLLHLASHTGIYIDPDLWSSGTAPGVAGPARAAEGSDDADEFPVIKVPDKRLSARRSQHIVADSVTGRTRNTSAWTFGGWLNITAGSFERGAMTRYDFWSDCNNKMTGMRWAEPALMLTSSGWHTFVPPCLMVRMFRPGAGMAQRNSGDQTDRGPRTIRRDIASNLADKTLGTVKRDSRDW